jgi:addiction module RelE/StbE family toxin
MREIRYTTRFKRDYKREKSGRHSKIIDAALINVVNLLAADIPLPPTNVDHPLLGNPLEETFKGKHKMWIGDCRVIYAINDKEHKIFILFIRHRQEVYRA